MSDPRYFHNIYRGAAPTRQQAANAKREAFADCHPATYGWQYTGDHPDYPRLAVWEKDGVKMMRHPAGDCWLVEWLGHCRRSEAHISQISEELNSIKFLIEFEQAAEQFVAQVKTAA